MQRTLLDTDMLSELLKLHDPIVRRHALAYTKQWGSLSFSAVTRYEIIRGLAYKGAKQQVSRFALFCQNSRILPVTDAIWDRAAELWAFARARGYPHKDADLVIAATALEEQASLATGNVGDFGWIPGLVIEDWRQP